MGHVLLTGKHLVSECSDRRSWERYKRTHCRIQRPQFMLYNTCTSTAQHFATRHKHDPNSTHQARAALDSGCPSAMLQKYMESDPVCSSHVAHPVQRGALRDLLRRCDAIFESDVDTFSTHRSRYYRRHVFGDKVRLLDGRAGAVRAHRHRWPSYNCRSDVCTGLIDIADRIYWATCVFCAVYRLEIGRGTITSYRSARNCLGV